MDREFQSINARKPQSASTIAGLQVVLYMTSKLTGYLEANCKGQPQYSDHDQMKAAYDAAMANCKSIASDPSVCVPKVAW